MAKIFECGEAISVASTDDPLLTIPLFLESILGNGSGVSQSRFIFLCRRHSFRTITQNQELFMLKHDS